MTLTYRDTLWEEEMLRLRYIFAALPMASFLSSCAIHPLPENVTGVNEYGAILNTHQIVRQIRCETALAAHDLIIEDLAYISQSDVRAKPTADRLLKRYAQNE